MFGSEPKLGLERAKLPDEVTALIYNEDQLEMALNGDPDSAEIDEAEEAKEDDPSTSNVSFYINNSKN